MRPEAAHHLGAILMWGGVLGGAAAVLAGVPARPEIGLAGLLAAAPLIGCGAWLKKRYCPRCRGTACDRPPRSGDRRS